MNIVIFFSDGFNTYNSSRWRASLLVKGLSMTDGEHVGKLFNMSHWQEQTPVAVGACSWADIIILQRMAMGDNERRMQLWQDRGKLVIIDYDDDYFNIRPDNTSYAFWHSGLNTQGREIIPHPILQFENNILAASAVSTPSSLLASDALARGVKFALYVPNLIDTSLTSNVHRKPVRDEIWLGWGGSMSHVPSWTESGALEGVTSILRGNKNVRLRLIGDLRIKNLFPVDVREKIAFSNYVEHRDWLGVLANTVDIGLAPLAGEYDCRRSHIKLVEYGALGIPFVATNAQPYSIYKRGNLGEGEFVHQGQVDRADLPNVHGWETALQYAIDTYVVRRYAAEEKIELTVRKYGVSKKNILEILDSFNTVQRYYCK